MEEIYKKKYLKYKNKYLAKLNIYNSLLDTDKKMLYLHLQSKKGGAYNTINRATKAFTECINKNKDYKECEKLLNNLESKVNKGTAQNEARYNIAMSNFEEQSRNLDAIQRVLGNSRSNSVNEMEVDKLLHQILGEESQKLSMKLPSVPKTMPSNIPIICRNCAKCLVDNYDKDSKLRGIKSLVCLPNCKKCADSNKEHPMVKSENFQKALELMKSEERINK